MPDYETTPGLRGWTYIGLDVARQRLVWWLAVHGQTHGRISKGGSAVGDVRRHGDAWIWIPKGACNAYRLDPANGRVVSRVQNIYRHGGCTHA